MNFHDILRSLDLIALAFTFGATAWVFFVQSPVLLASMGRDRFVPVQMQVTRLLFSSLIAATALTLVAAAASALPGALVSCAVISAAIALAAVLAARFVVLPRAFAAGGKRRKETFGQNVAAGGLGEFAAEGLGGSAKAMHRVIVGLVLVTLAASAVHAAQAFIL